LSIHWIALPAGVEEVNILKRGHIASIAFPIQEAVFTRWYATTPFETFENVRIILVRGGIAINTNNFPLGLSQVWTIAKPGYTIVIPFTISE